MSPKTMPSPGCWGNFHRVTKAVEPLAVLAADEAATGARGCEAGAWAVRAESVNSFSTPALRSRRFASWVSSDF